MIEWQEALAKAMGAIKCSPTERRRALEYLHTTGIAEKIGGGLADTVRTLVASGEIGSDKTDPVRAPHGWEGKA